ncbi:CDP-glycerol glycerophosphotransferase family protein [Sporolactobacillus sp. THM7-4]|nr:CDP-glycerol glycerophosphotransferase family protein [Sporolactobacillus sp. THM7-4]
MEYIVKFYIIIMNIVYFFLKLLPTQKKITMLSRESDEVPVDFALLEKEIIRHDPSYKVVLLPKMLHKTLNSKISYACHMYRQMYHLATSRLVILDTYCIAVSVLRHKEELKVIQIWHAMGALKKFGYSILDQPGGSTSKMARLMKMHHNYDYVLASSRNCIPFFSEAFRVPPEKIVVKPLPRTDLLLDRQYMSKKREEILRAYPRLKNKKNITYIPTFRKKSKIKIEDFVNKLDFNQYNFIVKPHPLMSFSTTHHEVIVPDEFSTLDVLSVSDFLVNDYSAFTFEAALLDKPMFFYVPDLKRYLKERNFYIDYHNEMPGLITDNAGTIIDHIRNNDYDLSLNKKFREKYVTVNRSRSATADIVDFMFDVIGSEGEKKPNLCSDHSRDL